MKFGTAVAIRWSVRQIPLRLGRHGKNRCRANVLIRSWLIFGRWNDFWFKSS
jgi:disulfide bond formation protein DsbB